MAAAKSKSTKSRAVAKSSTAKTRKPKKRVTTGTRTATPSKARQVKKTSKSSTSARTKTQKTRTKTLKTAELESVFEKAHADLGEHTGPAWIVDAEAAQLIALNEAGARVFGCDRNDSQSIALDSAMPAVTTLRARAKKKGGRNRSPNSDEDTLLFWTADGSQTFACQITHYHVRKRSLFLIRSKDGTTQPTDRNTAPADPPRDDAAILREIARRIRAGRDGTQPIEDVPGELPTPTSSVEIPAPSRSADNTPSLDQKHRAELAHELRTPISAIVAAAEVLKDERLGILDNFHYRDYARDIYQSASHALELIEKGLNVETDSEPALTPPASNRADLNQIARSTVATVKHLAVAARLNISFVPSERDAWLKLDPTAVTQVLLNLLTNAVKFTDPGGRITVQVVANLGEDVYVEIRDTGRGMSQHDIEQHLSGKLEPGKYRRAGGGLGLGLALSRQLAEANGASLDLKSARGRGTTARLTFPLRQLIAA